jgi:hypothetical protein
MEEPDMANQPNPNHPYDPDRLIDPLPTDHGADDIRSPARLESDLQADPELAVSSGKIALFAIGIAVVLGAIFYGLNNSSMHQNGASSTPPPATAQNTGPALPPVAPPGMRDVTPRRNTSQGVTTGAAPAPTPAAPANNPPASK